MVIKVGLGSDTLKARSEKKYSNKEFMSSKNKSMTEVSHYIYPRFAFPMVQMALNFCQLMIIDFVFSIHHLLTFE